MRFAGIQVLVTGEEEGSRGFPSLPSSRFQTPARTPSLPCVLCLPVSFLYTGCPVFLFFVFFFVLYF